jgi:hypothetical protein
MTMAYFELKADFALRPEVINVRKNDVWSLLDLARWIQNGKAREGIKYFVNKKEVTAIEYAEEVMSVYAEYDRKFRETHKRIWIQQGAISRSGYYKWIKVA